MARAMFDDRFAVLLWALIVASLVVFPLAAVEVSRRSGLGVLVLLSSIWSGSLIGYGTWLGAPELSAVMIGVPWAGAVAVAWRTRATPPASARGRSVLTMIALFIPSLFVGLWWGLTACRGGCL